MHSSKCRILVLILVLFSVTGLNAQDSDQPAYWDTSLSPEKRAADLVHRMTVEEKVSQLVNQSRAIPRLNVPDYDWWSEALHGVANNGGITTFPEPVGLAATFDTDVIHQMAIATSIEARIKYVEGMKDGHSDIFQGLDFWAPNINIFRDPRWGRGQETYGEDPFLTGRMGVAFVTGMQGDDPKYYRVISTPKHYAVHSGPESTRHKADVAVSKHDELDTYLPAFRATVTEARAASVMCAYNSINGQPACVNEFLLQDQLRNKWKFQGYVVSDCDAVVNIFRDHHFTKTQPEASALAIQRGMDNECIDFAKVKDDHDYRPYYDAYKQGFLKESEIDTALIRLFTARMKLGMFDPPEMVPYYEDRSKRTGQPGAPGAGANDCKQVHGAAQERWDPAVEAGQTQYRPGRSAGRSNQISARQLQRKSDPYCLCSRRPESGVSGSANQFCCRDAVPANRWRTGALVCVEHRGRAARAHRQVFFGSQSRRGRGIGDAHGRNDRFEVARTFLKRLRTLIRCRSSGTDSSQ